MIGIVILNYNEWKLTIDCIWNIIKTCKLKFRIYVVDNASNIECPSEYNYLFEEFNDLIVLIRSKKNGGYAAGNNLGIKRALIDKCEYILISNNDVIFNECSIENLYLYLKENRNVGIVGPKIFLPNGEMQEINMGCKMTLRGKYQYLLRKTPLKKMSMRFVKEFHCEEKDKTEPFEVYAVSGCCFMLSYEAISQLYPLDENTFLYEEENIIGIEMEKMNLKTVYDVNSTIIHIGGASTTGISKFSYSCFVESEIYYCKKYLGASKGKIFPLFVFRTLVYLKNYGIKGISSYFDITLKKYIGTTN